jgi:hypothetical protein
VKASAGVAITPASARARAMCGLPTTASPAIALTCSQVTGAPSSASRATIARARRVRSSRISSVSAASAGSAESHR